MQTPAQGQGQTACGSTHWALRNAPAQGDRSGGAERVAESETARVTARSTKRNAGTEDVKADGVVSDAKTRKADDAGVPT